MTVRLDWLGTATYRLVVDDLVVFLDAYMDRVAAAPSVGLTAAEVDRADFILVGHSHFDHLWGAERIAHNTGATIIGSHETVRIMHDLEEVPEAQLIATAGGERFRLSDDVIVSVFPSLHSCIWSRAGAADEDCFGDFGLVWQERRERLRSRPFGGDRPPEVSAHLEASNQGARGEGGALAYLVDTPEGSIFWKDTAGHYTGICVTFVRMWRSSRPRGEGTSMGNRCKDRLPSSSFARRICCDLAASFRTTTTTGCPP